MATFDQQVVWITGASSGLGHAMALEFARRGADLALSARRADRLEALREEVVRLGRRAAVFPLDVTDEAAQKDAVAAIVERFGRLDVAVANAGFGVSGRVERLTAEDWRRQLETNVIGAVVTATVALPALKASRGRVALVGSVSAMVTMPTQGAYCASKYAVRAFGQALAMELHGTGVSCTLLHPGFVESEIARVDNRGSFHADRTDPRPAALMWPTARAARVMVQAIARRKREVTFTGHGRVGAWFGRHWPGLVHFVMARAAGAIAGQQRGAGA